MENQYIVEFIKQRMQEMGYVKYHWEPVRIQSDSGIANIDAYNEFYYLVAKVVSSHLIILSDTHVFNEGITYSNFSFYNFHEFSGSIRILQGQGDPFDYEFIRVVPE